MYLALFMGRLYNTMNSTPDGIVAPASEQIASVDDNGPFDRRRINELACRALDLESSSVILEEECDGAVILPSRQCIFHGSEYSC